MAGHMVGCKAERHMHFEVVGRHYYLSSFVVGVGVENCTVDCHREPADQLEVDQVVVGSKVAACCPFKVFWSRRHFLLVFV